jgi:hypothetical protein
MSYAEVFLRVIILYWLFVFVDFDEIVDQYCLKLVVRFLDIGGTVVLLCLNFLHNSSIVHLWHFAHVHETYLVDDKGLKRPNGYSETVYRRRTDNTMAKEKVQKDKQRSTKHTHKTKDRVTRTPLKTGGEVRWSGRVSSSCSTSGTCRYKPGDKSWMRKGPVSVYDKWSISVVNCDTDIP